MDKKFLSATLAVVAGTLIVRWLANKQYLAKLGL